MVVDFLRRAGLHDPAHVHDRQPVAHLHGLGLIVRHIDERRFQPLMQADDLIAQFCPHFRVQVRQRLVEQEHDRLAHHRPPQRHALALATGQHARAAVEQIVDIEDLCRRLHAALDLLLRELHALERKRHVLIDRQMRIERKGLEDHRNVALHRLERAHVLAVKAERPLRRLFQPCDQTQKRAFSAAGRPQQHDEFVIGYRQVDLLERLRAVRIDHADAGKLNFSHLIRSCFIKLRCRRSFHPRSHCNNDSTGPRETQPRAARFLSLCSASAVGCI